MKHCLPYARASGSQVDDLRSGSALGGVEVYDPVVTWDALERVKGIEPSTRSLGSYCSTTELHPLFKEQSDLLRTILQAPYRPRREPGRLGAKGLGAP